MKHLKLLVWKLTMIAFTALLFTSCKPDKEPDVLSVTPSAISFDAREPQEQSVTITTNVEVWDYQVSENWITAEKQENMLYISVQNYTDTKQARTAVITVTAGDAPAVSVTITQKAKDIDNLSVNPTSLNFTANDTGEKTVAVTTNAPSWSVSSGASWITVSKSGNNVNVKVTQNTSTSERSGNVTVKGGDAGDVIFSVTQAGAPQSLTVSPDFYTFTSNAGSTSVSVTSNISWTAAGNASWLTVSPASGSNNGSLTISVTANTSTSQRTGAITVSGSGLTRTVTVTQSGRTTTQPPQVRFRKTSNNANTYEMAVATTGFSQLAYYQFGTSTGTTSYYSITAGNHLVLINEGGDVYTMCWNNCSSDTYNFQSNHRYTFEYNGSGYTMIEEGTYNLSNEAAHAPQQPGIDVSAKKNVVEGLNSLQNMNR